MYNVSVIIPVYNSGKYLKKCIDSIVNQTLDLIEIIIVDDGSTDNSLTIAEEYSRSYPDSVKVYSIKNGGQGIARNYGVKMASGKYLAFVDSDDYIDCEMYEILFKYAETNDCELTICPYYRVDELGTVINVEMNNTEQAIININSGPTNKLFKRDIWLEKKVMFSEDLWYEDLEATMKYLFNCKKIGWVNEKPLYYYVQRLGSSINLYNERVNDIFQVFDRIYDYLTDYNLLNDNVDEIEYHFIMHLVFGHLSRCVGEKSLIKTNKYIKQTKIYLRRKFPHYYKNKYFKWSNIDNNSLFMKLLKFVGLKLFYFNLFDSILLMYRIKLKFNKNITRW